MLEKKKKQELAQCHTDSTVKAKLKSCGKPRGDLYNLGNKQTKTKNVCRFRKHVNLGFTLFMCPLKFETRLYGYGHPREQSVHEMDGY